MQYAHASEDFERFIRDARDALLLQTRHQAFTVVQAVLWVFRRRLDASSILKFAAVLPPVLAAIFIQDWEPASRPVPFADGEALTHEVRMVRSQHNLSPDESIRIVSEVVRRHVDAEAFGAVLRELPPGAATFWGVARGASPGSGG
jgi:uncharacterized protein (DUF2267 family)